MTNKGQPNSLSSVTHLKYGQICAWGTSLTLALYIPTLALGFASLKSNLDPISDPYVSILEILILLTAPFMVGSMIAVYRYAAPKDKVYGLSAVICMTIMAVITSSVHFIILTVSRQIEAAGFNGYSYLFSFKWPSVLYTLDILAWDWFFALAMFSAAPIFKSGKLETTLKVMMIGSGVLSMVGLLGVPLAMMQVESWLKIRNIGIIGYTAVAFVVFTLMGVLFRRRSKRV
jgi:hypothetical protein